MTRPGIETQSSGPFANALLISQWSGAACTQLIGFKHCDVTETFKHQSFVCTQLNEYTLYVSK